jgi:hypothetical protein
MMKNMGGGISFFKFFFYVLHINMNTLMLAVIALVAFIYCGGSRVPPVLRQNKDMILGASVGLVLCSFFGMRLEGMFGHSSKRTRHPGGSLGGVHCANNSDCASGWCSGNMTGNGNCVGN